MKKKFKLLALLMSLMLVFVLLPGCGGGDEDIDVPEVEDMDEDMDEEMDEDMDEDVDEDVDEETADDPGDTKEADAKAEDPATPPADTGTKELTWAEIEGPYFAWFSHPTPGEADSNYVEINANPAVFTLKVSADGALKSVSPAMADDFELEDGDAGKGMLWIYGTIEPEGNKINLPSAAWSSGTHYTVSNPTGLKVVIARESSVDAEVIVEGVNSAVTAGTIVVTMKPAILGGADAGMVTEKEMAVLRINVVVE